VVEPGPVRGWTAADVVGHLLEWVPGFFGDPDVAGRTFTHPVAGTHTVEQAITTFVLGDVLVHTWDLARAAGLDESLDADEVHALLVGLEPVDDVLRASGHDGPKVEVPADADEQARLLAFTGRRP